MAEYQDSDAVTATWRRVVRCDKCFTSRPIHRGAVPLVAVVVDFSCGALRDNKTADLDDSGDFRRGSCLTAV